MVLIIKRCGTDPDQKKISFTPEQRRQAPGTNLPIVATLLSLEQPPLAWTPAASRRADETLHVRALAADLCGSLLADLDSPSFVPAAHTAGYPHNLVRPAYELALGACGLQGRLELLVDLRAQQQLHGVRFPREGRPGGSIGFVRAPRAAVTSRGPASPLAAGVSAGALAGGASREAVGAADGEAACHALDSALRAELCDATRALALTPAAEVAAAEAAQGWASGPADFVAVRAHVAAVDQILRAPRTPDEDHLLCAIAHVEAARAAVGGPAMRAFVARAPSAASTAAVTAARSRVAAATAAVAPGAGCLSSGEGAAPESPSAWPWPTRALTSPACDSQPPSFTGGFVSYASTDTC